MRRMWPPGPAGARFGAILSGQCQAKTCYHQLDASQRGRTSSSFLAENLGKERVKLMTRVDYAPPLPLWAIPAAP